MTYHETMNLVDEMEMDDIITIDVLPDNQLRTFRKYLSEIGAREHKKYTTKIKNNKLYIMRVKYFSVTNKLNAND